MGFADKLSLVKQAENETATQKDLQPNPRTLRLTGLIAACAVLAGGCGSAGVNSAARQAAQAACLQADTSIKDPTVKQSADQACNAVGSGDTTQLTLAAKQAARLACLRAVQQIPDATAQAGAKAACPPGK